MFADRLRNIRAYLMRFTQNPVQQRKLRRGVIVAAIAVLGVGGLDYVITGGPSWNPIGADAPRFEIVASAAAAEHAPLPRLAPFAAAPLLPERITLEASLDTYDPNVSADDLLGAPVFVAEQPAEIELAVLLETFNSAVKPADAPLFDLSIEPLVLRSFDWR
jgi:hypothetical protein